MVDEGRGVRTCLCCEDEDLKNTAFATTHTFTHTHLHTHTVCMFYAAAIQMKVKNLLFLTAVAPSNS